MFVYTKPRPTPTAGASPIPQIKSTSPHTRLSKSSIKYKNQHCPKAKSTVQQPTNLGLPHAQVPKYSFPTDFLPSDDRFKRHSNHITITVFSMRRHHHTFVIYSYCPEVTLAQNRDKHHPSKAEKCTTMPSAQARSNTASHCGLNEYAPLVTEQDCVRISRVLVNRGVSRGVASRCTAAKYTSFGRSFKGILKSAPRLYWITDPTPSTSPLHSPVLRRHFRRP